MSRLASLLALISVFPCLAQGRAQAARALRPEAEYYLAEYARHYRVPLQFARAIVEEESAWHECAVSAKGAVGLMQLMPDTARRFNVQNRCSIEENVSGGIRYLAWLIKIFHGDLRLVAAAYNAGEAVIHWRGLKYSNPQVVSYVAKVRERFARQLRNRGDLPFRSSGRRG